MARRLRGEKEMLSKAEQVLARGPKAAALGFRNWGSGILQLAAENAPLKDGDLRESGVLVVGGRECARSSASGQVQIVGAPPTVGNGNVVAKIVFTARHAVPQHERLDQQHTVGGPKYLERAIDVQGAQGLEKVAQAVREGLRQ